MIKSKLFLPFSLWLFFLALTLIAIYSYDPSSGTNTEKTNAMVSFTVLLYGPSVFLFGYYLKKKYVLGKKIYFFFLIESIWLFVMLLIASVANDSVTIVSIFFGIIPILPFWYKYRKNSYYLINKNNNSNIKIETPKQESPKQETPKQETPKQETPKQETPKPKFSYRFVSPTSHPKNLDDYFQQSISELIKLSESEFLEFKSTLKWDIRLEKANPELVGEIIKTIAGFLNNKGGVLVIGYDDDNNVLYGLEKDYPVTSKKSNYDGWQQYFINQVNERLGKEINHYFTIEPIPHDGKTIARINVSKSPKPVFAKQNKQGGDFFVRIHGQTENLNPEDTNNWIKEHFSN